MASELKVGDLLRAAGRDYVKVATIGRGSYGEVASFWSQDARDAMADRLVAVKVPIFHRGRALAKLEVELYTLIQERSMERGLETPTVKLILSSQQDREMLCVMEHCAGTLTDLEEGISAQDAMYISKQLLQRLETLHSTAQTVHNDLKPDNVLLGFQSNLEKLQHAAYLVNRALSDADLGAAQKNRLSCLAAMLRAEGAVPNHVNVDRNITRRQVYIADIGLASPIGKVPKTLTGTLGYMAPETMARGRKSYKLDIYAAGVTIAEVILGKPLLQIQGDTLKMQTLNFFHQIVQLKGPLSAAVIESFQKKNNFFVDGQLKASETAPKLPKLEDLLGNRCAELGWQDKDTLCITKVIAKSLRHHPIHRSIEAMLTDLVDN